MKWALLNYARMSSANTNILGLCEDPTLTALWNSIWNQNGQNLSTIYYTVHLCLSLNFLISCSLFKYGSRYLHFGYYQNPMQINKPLFYLINLKLYISIWNFLRMAAGTWIFGYYPNPSLINESWLDQVLISDDKFVPKPLIPNLNE